METQQPSPSGRTGTPGLDVFKIASKSISRFLHSLKTDDPHQVRMPYTTTLEAKLACSWTTILMFACISVVI